MRLFIVTLDREEVVAVPHGLNENERTVQHQRYNPGEDKCAVLYSGPSSLAA